jgi:hypothetical protein
MLDCVWGLGIVLEFSILARSLFSGNYKRFPFFYIYILAGTTQAVGLIFIRNAVAYRSFYWPAQFITLFIGCGLVVEIFVHVLSAYPGVETFSIKVCLIALVAIVAGALIYVRMTPAGALIASEPELEKKVRIAQIILFVGLLGAIVHYGISLGKNMRGMLIGYGLYLGTSLVSLALRSYFGSAFSNVWRFVQPSSFDVSLLIWLIALWSDHPNPPSGGGGGLESDYEALVALTKGRVKALRGYLGRPTRPKERSNS